MTIRNALDIIERATCVRFEEKSSKMGLTAYINVIKSDGYVFPHLRLPHEYLLKTRIAHSISV